MTRSILTAAALCVPLLTGCASIMHGTHQRVVLDIQPSWVEVVVTDIDPATGRSGVTFIYAASPGLEVGLQRSKTHRVSASAASARGEVTLTPTLTAWTWGNLIWFPLGGPLGVGVALVVDWLIGGIWELEPDPVVIDLRRAP